MKTVIISIIVSFSTTVLFVTFTWLIFLLRHQKDEDHPRNVYKDLYEGAMYKRYLIGVYRKKGYESVVKLIQRKYKDIEVDEAMEIADIILEGFIPGTDKVK